MYKQINDTPVIGTIIVPKAGVLFYYGKLAVIAVPFAAQKEEESFICQERG
jgi:hypothetical protein